MLVKTKIKQYPDGSIKAYVYDNPFLYNVDEEKTGSYVEKTPEEIEEERKHSEYQNLRRSKTNIQDYILSNDFDLFVTLTFNSERDDDERCFKKLDNWLRYMRKKHGKFRYILIPERHKTGELHFHGVFGDFKGGLTDSTKKYKGKTIYNLTEWNYGFTNCSKIIDKKKTASYVTKYMTKNLHDSVEKGKKKYWSSRGLRKPDVIYLDEPLFEDVQPSFQSDVIKIYNIN